MRSRAAVALFLAALGVHGWTLADDTVPCLVSDQSGVVTLTLGRFQPSAAALQQPAASDRAAACPDPAEVLPSSQAPFWWGTATAAYQIEGAAAEGGRTPSVWDVFAHTPGKTFEGDTGDVAVHFYHRYAGDIALMQSLGVRNFRFSISWTRLLPNGTGEPSPEGVAFYTRLIDALKAACIEPYITLYHWDFPQSLYKQYGGWISERVVADFTAYAEAAFKLFGDRVKHWVTLNEPETFCEQGYGSGVHAPGRCSDRSSCAEGDSSTEPHLCSYYALLAHASAVRSFRKLVPDGRIAMSNAIGMSVPLTDSPADVAAAERQLTFGAGHFLDPIYTGDWSEVRKAAVGSALPAFTPRQRQLLLDARQDFIALQHYTSRYTYHNASAPPLNASDTSVGPDGVPLPRADSPWLYVFPSAFRGLLGWLHRRYNQSMVVTENGCSAPGEGSKPVVEVRCDQFRVDYFRQYIGNATAAVEEDGVPLEGYFAWSLLDTFEWADGYSNRFGVVYADVRGDLGRYYKASSMWLARHFGTANITAPPAGTQQQWQES